MVWVQESCSLGIVQCSLDILHSMAKWQFWLQVSFAVTQKYGVPEKWALDGNVSIGGWKYSCSLLFGNSSGSDSLGDLFGSRIS